MFQHPDQCATFYTEMDQYVKNRINCIHLDQGFFKQIHDVQFGKTSWYGSDFIPHFIKYENAYGNFAKIDEHAFNIRKANTVERMGVDLAQLGLMAAAVPTIIGVVGLIVGFSAAPLFVSAFILFLASTASFVYAKYQEVNVDFAKNEITRLTDHIAYTDPKNIKSI